MKTVKVREVRSADDGYSISQDWYEPEYTDLHRFLCRIGLHEFSRGLRANGWAGFNQTMRYECACGRYMWLRDHIGYSGRMKAGGHSTLPSDYAIMENLSPE